MGRIFKYYLGAQILLNVSVIHIPARTLGNAAPHVNNDKKLSLAVVREYGRLIGVPCRNTLTSARAKCRAIFSWE